MAGKMALVVLLTIGLAITIGGAAVGYIDRNNHDVDCHLCHEMGDHGDGGKPLKTEYQGNDGCIYCHSSPDPMIEESPNPQCDEDDCVMTYILNPGGTVEIKVPIVVYTGASAPTSYLAGGNFWWVKGPANGIPGDVANWTGGADDRKGHNIFEGEVDEYWNVEWEDAPQAPGAYHGISCGDPNSCHNNLHGPITFQGTRQGCTKCHMMGNTDSPSGYHHKDDTGPVIDTADEGWFRFLDGHMGATGLGVEGIEDPDWQATSGPGAHNEYRGYQDALGSAGGFTATGPTVTSFCSGCHGAFHVQECSGEPACYGEWIRHMAGAPFPNSGEFANAFGAGGTGEGTYDPGVPLARPDLTGWTDADTTVTLGEDGDLVNCLSCHRAHGSPYPKMLRWDLTGCKICHTNK
jgi:predicted CXXCH cytochrome family protein